MDVPLSDIDWMPKEMASRLLQMGISSLLELAYARTEELMGLGISHDEAIEIGERACRELGVRRGSELVRRGKVRGMITTGSKALNSLLDGGVKTGLVTDFFGASGTGKTQICFRLCVSSQLQGYKSEGSQTVVYVDSCGTFRPERVAEIAEYANLDREGALNRLLVMEARSVGDQLRIPRELKALARDSRVILLIIDTLTENFVFEYHGEDGLIERQSSLAEHLHDLSLLALNFDIAVVFTNTVRMRLNEEHRAYEVETGGNVVAQGAHIRVHLAREGDALKGRLMGPLSKVREASLRLSEKGIVDL